MTAQVFDFKTKRRMYHLEADPSERIRIPTVGIFEHLSSDLDTVEELNKLRTQCGQCYQYFVMSLVNIGLGDDIAKIETSQKLAVALEMVIAAFITSRGYDHQFAELLGNLQKALALRMENKELIALGAEDMGDFDPITLHLGLDDLEPDDFDPDTAA